MPGPAWIAPAAIALGGAVINAFSARRGRKGNEGYIKAQNEYNTPRNQMSRFQDAGLNPNLIYGQGNPGNQSQVANAPDISHAGSDLVSSYNSSSVAQSQVSAQSAQKERTRVLTEIDKLKGDILARNPILDDSVFNSLINSMIATANDKMNKANLSRIELKYAEDKIQSELRLLEQRFHLGTADAAIKAKVIESKEFQNAILEVQKKFLADGNVGPQQVLDFVKLLLMKIR